MSDDVRYQRLFCIASPPKTSETDLSLILFWYIMNPCIFRASKPTTSPLRNTRNTAEITLIQVSYVVFIENWPDSCHTNGNHQILAWTVLLRHCFGSHSEGCLHVPFRPMSLGERKAERQRGCQDELLAPASSSPGAVWTLRDGVFWHPKHHPWRHPERKIQVCA